MQKGFFSFKAGDILACSVRGIQHRHRKIQGGFYGEDWDVWRMVNGHRDKRVGMKIKGTHFQM